MALNSGDRIGPYEIVRALGAGGMGEVYLAEDTRLLRRVALKVLPSHLSSDEPARKRLLHEARAAATLTHPGICTVYDVGEDDGRGFIAMQYLEGESLAGLLKRGPLDRRVALDLVRQVAAAIAEAHARGIIHRDIKPQNVMVSAERQATVLDFGIATPVAKPDAGSDTATSVMEYGLVSGTLSYMSPEQARGDEVDERTDIFNLGILLYEAVTGTHPFEHDRTADTLAAIMAKEPRPIGVDLPPELRRILRKLLEKDRTRRYQTVRDVAIDLENLGQEIDTATVPPSAPLPVPAARSRPRRGWVLALGALATVVAVAAGAAIVLWRTSPPPMSQAGYEPLTDFTDSATAAALSPDGRMIAFIRGGSAFLTASGQIYVKLLPNGEAVKLTDDSRAKLAPAFSADGTRVAYTVLASDGTRVSWDTMTVPVSGGQPTRLLPNAAGLTWIDPTHVLFSEIQAGTALHMGLVTSTLDRAGARMIYLPAHERAMAHYSYLSPDRRSVLVVEMGKAGTFERCRVVPFDGNGTGQEVGPEGVCQAAAWSPDGRWMYFAANVRGQSHLWRQRYPGGTPEPITSGPATQEEGVAVAPDGRSIVTSIGKRDSALWLHDAAGERRLSSEGSASRPKLSPDAKRLYYLLRRAAAPGVSELTVMDLESGKADRLLPDFSVVDFAVSRDEQEVAFTSAAADGTSEIWLGALDRRSAPRRVAQSGDLVTFGAKGDLLFRSIEGQVNFVNRIGRDGANRVRIFDHNSEFFSRVSPDGKWLTQVRGRPDAAIMTVAMAVYGGEPRTVCRGACVPVWSPDARWLYLFSPDSTRPMLAVPLPSGQAFPEFPEAGDGATAWAALPNARRMAEMTFGMGGLEQGEFVPGLDPSTYVFAKTEERRNIFRIPLER